MSKSTHFLGQLTHINPDETGYWSITGNQLDLDAGNGFDLTFTIVELTEDVIRLYCPSLSVPILGSAREVKVTANHSPVILMGSDNGFEIRYFPSK